MSDRHTLVHQIADWAQRIPNQPALFGKDASGSWKPTTWKQYWSNVRDVAKALMVLGHQPGEGVGVVGANRPEWVTSQYGAAAARGIPTPIYPTSTKEQFSHIIKNSGSKILICDGAAQLEKYLEAEAEGLFTLEKIVTMDSVVSDNDKVISFDELLELGAMGGDDEALDARLAAIQPDDTGLFIYTSGTTGVPKGAELSHRGLVRVGEALDQRYPELRKEPFRIVSYLPLSHVAEQIFTSFLHLAHGGEVYFLEDMSQIKDALLEVHPTVFLGVPRVWEKFETALRGKLSSATGLKAKLAEWAMKTELAAFEESVAKDRNIDRLTRRIANALVISKIKTALGLDNLLVAGSGAAPISRATLEFFASIGIVIHEGYGMTETSGLLTTAPYRRPRFGTVGQAIPGVELRIGEDGEILARGENMAKGYFKMPEATAELLDEDGWLHTGDIGTIDERGFLSITGRKKDLLITAAGKNVAPSEMEQHLIRLPGVGQAVVVGDRKPYLCALLALDPDATEQLCSAAGVDAKPLDALAKDPKVRAFLERGVEEVCNSKVARYQTIKKFEVLPKPFSVEGGEMTPSLKVKRNVVSEKYETIIERMYAES